MPPLIVGDWDEPHAAAVATELGARGIDPVVMDARSMSTTRWRWWNGAFEVVQNEQWQPLASGWVRRLAPAGLLEGLRIGSRSAAEHASRLALLSALSSTRIKWLSDYWDVLRGENKLIQYQYAHKLGIAVPKTTVVSSSADINVAIGQDFVVKPLGPGQFVDLGQHYAVHSNIMNRDSPDLRFLNQAPFLLQYRVLAASHLRVVTVRDRTWTARLNATDLPLDWRESDEAHHSWEPAHIRAVEAQANALGLALRLGYSSQDWIVDTTGQAWFIDANPSGQWLFLPDAIAAPVTSAIADALEEREA